MGRKRVVIAMSGGVDSSTAAALLKEEGYDCIGISMQLWDYSAREDVTGSTGGSCCSLDDIYDARRVCDTLGIPFYVVNLEEVFSKEVVDYFISSYLEGRTPNPCIKCNQVLKFDVLLRKAISLESDFLATGHYARIVNEGGISRLFKGKDRGKDQSYFLFTMTGEKLRRILFPLGNLAKEEVRAHARRFNLRTSDKKESQEICFVQEPSYGDFVSLRAGTSVGDIIDVNGKVLGQHRGLFRYTVGQRKGLNLSGGPFYVVGMDLASKSLMVGPVDGLFSRGLIAGEVNWINGEPDGSTLRGIKAKIRYRHAPSDCEVRLPGNGTVSVEFATPQKSVTPGQAVVFYRNDEVLGGGWIEKAIR